MRRLLRDSILHHSSHNQYSYYDNSNKHTTSYTSTYDKSTRAPSSPVWDHKKSTLTPVSFRQRHHPNNHKHAITNPSPSPLAHSIPQHGRAPPIRSQPHYHDSSCMASWRSLPETSKDECCVSFPQSTPHIVPSAQSYSAWRSIADEHEVTSLSTQSSSVGRSRRRGGLMGICDFLLLRERARGKQKGKG